MKRERKAREGKTKCRGKERRKTKKSKIDKGKDKKWKIKCRGKENVL